MQCLMMKENEENVLYSNSSFPLSFLEEKLFLGLNIHKSSKKIMNDLSIKFIVEIKESLDTKNICEHIEDRMIIHLNKM